MNFRRSRTRSRRNSMNIMISTEKWRTYGRKLSRKDKEYLEEDSVDDLPQACELKDWFEEFFMQNNAENDQSDQDVEVNLTKKQTLVLSTLVPDEILLMKNFSTGDPKKFVGVLMMADVSGYTALSEKYNNTGKGGTYKLTVTLNTYLGSLIEVIYSHGGDIIKFAGDAFLALWKTDKRTFLSHTIHTAITCALIIQHSFGSYETDVKVNLKVKLAISAGNLIFAPIGTGIDMNYIIIGLPVIEAKVAESLCASGEVKLTPTAWGHCYSRNYDHFIDGDSHVTIKSILYDPRENDVSKPFPGFGAMIRQANKSFITIENLPDHLLDNATKGGTTISKANELLTLRKTILIAKEKNIGSEIRKFMIRPVLTQIDAHQPLEYLTEMRQVSVLFVTLKPRECPFPQLITIVNNSYQISCEIVYKSMGCVNKIILFDKDIMILVIFGLRGFKHESEAQAALKCAFSIKKSVSALDGVIEVSIGVTTGQVYCGVVGHPFRREFTVIGATVNKAARLMCGFRNKITCDEATFVKSKMSSNGFTLQPPTELKGIVHPGKIYEYTEEIRAKELYNIPLTSPLLNRSDEMEYFENWINDYHLSFRDFDALLLIGESRIGKTRLLQWMARYAKNKDLTACHLSLTSIHSATPYLALNQIIEQMLGLDKPIIGFAKEEKIVNLLSYYCDELCYLNNVLKVRFAYHEEFSSQNEILRKEKEKKIFKKLISCLSKTYVIFLDDLQNLDAFSWDFLAIMIENMKIFTVLTVTRGKFCSVHSWLYNVFIKNNIRKIVLGTISSTWIIPLACQILDVQAVSEDLCNALEAKCTGMPGLVESFIVHLFSNGALNIKKVRENELDSWQDENLQFPDPNLLRPIAINANDQPLLDQFIKENITEEISICFVIQKDQLNIDINIQNVDALIMMQIDSLTPYQQLLLKIASVIGNVLSRHLLENIMYENNPLTTAKAIKRLFAMRILSCANSRYNKMASTGTLISNYSVDSNLSCECCFDYDSDMNDGLPKYAFCKVMKFRNKNSRKTFYDLLPLNQKKEFHLRIIHYLENNNQKCPNCGGTVMIVQSLFNLQPNIMTSIEKQYANEEYLEDSKSDSYFELQCEKENTIPYNSHSLRDTKSGSLNMLNKTVDHKQDSLINSGTKSSKSETTFINVSQCAPILKVKSSYDNNTDIRRRSTKRVTMSNICKTVNSEMLKGNSIFDNLRGVTEAKTTNDWHSLGVIDSEDKLRITKTEKQKKSLCINLEKGVSKTDYSKCTCTDINIIILEQLIQHAKEAEVKFKVIDFLIKYSYFNVLENNFENALPKLEEVESICLDKTVSDIADFDRKRFLGKIYSLKAASYLISGRHIIAKLNIEKAARIYHMNLKKISNFLQIRTLLNAAKFNRKKHRLRKALMQADTIFFLNVATVLYSTLDDEDTSRIAALRSLYLVQRIECSVIDLCDTLANMIQMELDRGMPELTVDLEKISYNCLESLKRPIKADEMFAIGKLLFAIFRARTARGQIASAIRSGFRALVISLFLHADKISIDIIPDLFYLLLARCRIEEAVEIVNLLLKLGENQTTLECETWYYALSLDMILDAGFQLESPYEISRFAEFSLHKGKAAGESRRRLVIGLWTYCLRSDFEKKAKRYENEALNWSTRDNEDGSLKTIISGIRLAEAMLESLASKVDDLKKVVDVMELRSLADRELGELERDARNLRTIYPRWLLLKANSLRLSGRLTTATVFFNQAVEEARRINNHLEQATALAATSNSISWIQNARSGNFLHWNILANETTKTSWHHFLYKVFTNRNV
ncbi:adenylate cyclase type 10-like [Vanessa atalanta]|uniref:adenylate cyclase type 10-like n=1 Tax=Vanessa atalanta TaxID=42275 RepID=UPI001FCD8A30|nr:adenylate cyclase type 10-like [Vanessa atalanta]